MRALALALLLVMITAPVLAQEVDAGQAISIALAQVENFPNVSLDWVKYDETKRQWIVTMTSRSPAVVDGISRSSTWSGALRLQKKSSASARGSS